MDHLNLDPELNANLFNIDKLDDKELISLFFEYAMPLVCLLGLGVLLSMILFRKLIRY